ncbi:CPBP family intramembrane glutamic endopeptidase [Roseivivax isoporae]|uniref:Abortive phage infection protein n=1 Tax=Roseivivax isoporae LMG 25204 TaxID=1449351 RepID=X7F4J6_9RHOB|nr:CPBP family intramembrane glutamic endopeptidase [Roseivivax isoporae]ETX26979.1 abortive phage infection protein [Roseivivax isoporae LMG 25204]
MRSDSETWFLSHDQNVQDPRLPEGVEYHRVYAGQKSQFIRGVIAIVLLFAGLVALAQLCLAIVSTVEERFYEGDSLTPLRHAAGLFSLALLIPYSMLIQHWLYGLPAGSLHSVAGSFRFSVFGRSLLAFGPFLLTVMSVGFLLSPVETIPWSTADLVAFFIIGMTLTPLAAAGEEYGFRGVMFRVVGSWTRGSLSGALLGIVATTVLFSLFHGTLDPYILGSYLVLFGAMAIITWRTGGLEVAAVLHGTYNVSALVLATTLHVDLGGDLSSRGEIVGTPANLVPSAAIAVITAIVWWTTRKSGPARTPVNGLRI